MTYIVQKSIEFDAGHRVPDHASKCRNPHGHRYKVEACVGSRALQPTGSERGMVLDFGRIKQLLQTKVHDPLDHGFIVASEDHDLLAAFNCYDETNNFELCSSDYGWKVIILPYVPTAENLARWIYDELDNEIKKIGYDTDFEVWLDAVIVYETPNSKAIYRPGLRGV